MISFSDCLDLIHAMMTKAQKNILTKPECFRPVFNLYYMVIYVAINDSFSYGKVVSKSRNKRDYRYRNKRKAKERAAAREWLTDSEECKMMWEDISDVNYSLFQEILGKTYRAFVEEAAATTDELELNVRNRLSVETSNRLKGLSI